MSSKEVKRLKSHCEEIAEQLKCCMCFHFAKPPIKQCISGHLCCFSCLTDLRNCPTCRDPFVQSNILVNNVASTLVEPCPFKVYGCSEILNLGIYNNHLEKCLFRQIFCKICYQTLCAKDIWEHMLSAHEDINFMGEFNFLQWNKFNFNQKFQSNQIIKAFDELFWCCFSYYIDNESFNIAVQYIGPKQKAEKYYYEVDTGANNKNRLLFQRTTHHYMESVKDNLKTDGISIKKNFINLLIENDSLCLYLNLYKKEQRTLTEEN